MQIRENSQRNSGVSNEKTNKICSVVLICLSLSDNDLVVTKTEINMLIVFANQKGGVGKSTLALLFSDYLGMAGYRCRVLDCDKQQSIFEKYLLDLTFEGIHYDTEKIQNDDCPVPVNPNSLFRIERLPFDVLSGAIRGWLDNGEDSFTDSSIYSTCPDSWTLSKWNLFSGWQMPSSHRQASVILTTAPHLRSLTHYAG